jgi:hypothetical protein
MRYSALAVAIIAVLAFGGAASAEQSLIDTVAKGCDKEIKTYCKDVTMGEGRVLACLYAYEDKLSGKCEYALYDAAVRLQRAITALAYVANECEPDLKAYCSDIQPGGGRLLQCIEKNDAKVGKRCKQAMKDTGLK